MTAWHGRTAGHATARCTAPTRVKPASATERTANAPLPAGLASRASAAIATSGEPLDRPLRQRMEARFGHDFGAVRVHTDASAAAAARSVGARAYTVGQHIAFGREEYAPATTRGTELLAHELAHTVQQRSPRGADSPTGASSRAERTAEAAAHEVAAGHDVRQPFPSCRIGVARNVVPLDAYSDDDLAREIARLAEKLEEGDAGDREWRRERLRQAHAIASARKKAREPAPPPPAVIPAPPPSPPPPPVRDAAAERAEAVKEANALLAQRQEEKEDDAEPVVSMQLGKGRSTGRPAKKAPSRPTTLSLVEPDPRWSEGLRVAQKLDEDMKANRARIDAEIAHDREIAKKPYDSRLRLVRLKLQSRSDRWYSYKEAVSRMSGEEVWQAGLAMDLFLESEKKAVYEDQGELQKYIEEEIREKNRQLRAQFEIAQYRAHVARGEQLSSPAPILQPFAFVALGPLIGAAYGGTQTGVTFGQFYNACAKGSAEDCAAAAVPLIASAATYRATQSWMRPNTLGGNSTRTPPPTGRLRAGEDPTPPTIAPDPGEFQVAGFGRPLPDRTPAPPSGERQVAGFGRTIEPKPDPSPEPTIGFLRKPKPPGSTTDAPAGSGGGGMTTVPPAKEMPSSGGTTSTRGQVMPVTGARRDEPAQAMSGKRRVGEEHTSGARGSTEHKHEIGQTRQQRQNAAADLRNAAAREAALLSRIEQLKARFERIVKNMNRDRRRYLETEGVPVQDRYRSILQQELSAADLDDIATLRTQLRRELGIKGSELDDLIVDHLDRLKLMPTPLDD